VGPQVLDVDVLTGGVLKQHIGWLGREKLSEADTN